MPRVINTEPLFPLADIQGDILVGMPKKHEHLIFFEIRDVPKFRTLLGEVEITSAAECLAKRAAIGRNKAAGIETIIPAPGLNIAFTYAGLAALSVAGLPSGGSVATFQAGMAASQARLSDPPATNWQLLGPGRTVHGVFIVTGASHAEVVDVIGLRLAPAQANGWRQVHQEVGQVRPDPVSGHEHFGFADGVSQPGVRGRIDQGQAFMDQEGPDPDQAGRGQDLLWPGEFLFGYLAQDPTAANFTVPGPIRTPPAPFMADGAYLVFRRLAQKVPEFNAAVKAAAAAIPAGPNRPSATLLGAQLIGRWKSGAPLELAPLQDNPQFAEGSPDANNFEFGGDRDGVICPWAAHVRKAYPRNDVIGNTTPTPTQVDQAEAFTQTHRMLRRGIAFGPEVTEQEALAGASGQQRGLLFKCYVTSIENQFEFVQQSWCNNPNFVQPGSGLDPIIGQQPGTGARPFLGAAPVTGLPADKPSIPNFGLFVEMQGGEYFFAPSIPAIRAF